ncbi:c-type cytochrome [Tropicimonas marinistellae]|uniref:c-type cytochrome n=1 Tax=Tropicimonas marinistellae TaxID=1739787 RepID=UPI001F47D200|nr:c-type cytochrome [Tropicimonas marinistellae]
MRVLILIILLFLPPVKAMAQERKVRLHAPETLVDTGLMRHILPRFSLKTQIRVELVDTPDQADIVLGSTGIPLFEGAGQVWHLEMRASDDGPPTRFSDWLQSDVGQRTVIGFAPEGEALFAPPTAQEAEAVVVTLDGDAALGQRVSRQKCIRCHSVDDETRMAGIGSTPSFSVLRSLSDWQDRFAAFFALNPHPAFTIVENVTPPFPDNRPPPIAPIRLSLEEVEAVVAYVAAMEAADLGAPLQHQ